MCANGLIKLIQENPELEIVPLVDSDIIQDEGSAWWVGSFGSCYVDEFVIYKNHIYMKCDEDEVRNKVLERLANKFLTTPDKEILIMAEKEVEAMNWKKAIFVNIQAP